MAWRRLPRVRYSRWDGTQAGFDIDADAVFSELTDDLLYHGDLNAALRRLLQQGFRDRAGERIQGLRELLDEVRRRRQEELERHDLGGVYDEIAQELGEVVEMERRALDDLEAAARASNDPRRQELTEQSVAERRMQLDLLPPDLAHQVKSLQDYDFTSAEAQRRFDELMDRLREQLMQQYVNEMAGSMQSQSPEDLQRLKDMLADLNRMLAMRARGEDTQPAFDDFMASATATSSRRTRRPSTSCSR